MELTVHGRRAYAYTGGRPLDPTLPCLVFLHGAANDHSVWTLLARWAAHHGHAVLALDLPGHVRSEGPPLPDVESLGAWALAVLDAAGVQRAAWVGHSMGSLIALEAAAQAPERARALVMVGTAWPMKVAPALLATAAEAPQRAMAMVNTWSLATLAAKPGCPGPGSWLHGGGLALMQRVQATAPAGCNLFHHDFGVCDAYVGALQAAARVRCPVHFILGRQDQMTPPRATRELAQALQPRVHTVDSGHQLMAEAPDAVLAALRQALSPEETPR